MCTADGRVFGSVAEALRMTSAGMDYLNGPDGADLEAASYGVVLQSLGEIEATFTAARASVLARFDAADAHDSDGYGTSASWLDAMANMTRPDAKAEVWRLPPPRDHPALAAALAAAGHLQVVGAGDRGVDQEAPAGAARRDDQDPGRGRPGGRVPGSTCGSSPRSRLEKWRASLPDADDDGSDDRYVQVGDHVRRRGCDPRQPRSRMRRRRAGGTGGARQESRRRGHPHRGPAVPRSLQQGCELLIRAKMVPDRVGADTHVMVHTSLDPSCASTPKRRQPRRCGCAARRASPGTYRGRPPRRPRVTWLPSRW